MAFEAKGAILLTMGKENEAKEEFKAAESHYGGVKITSEKQKRALEILKDWLRYELIIMGQDIRVREKSIAKNPARAKETGSDEHLSKRVTEFRQKAVEFGLSPDLLNSKSPAQISTRLGIEVLLGDKEQTKVNVIKAMWGFSDFFGFKPAAEMKGVAGRVKTIFDEIRRLSSKIRGFARRGGI
jgi:hypothetical protein